MKTFVFLCLSMLVTLGPTPSFASPQAAIQIGGMSEPKANISVDKMNPRYAYTLQQMEEENGSDCVQRLVEPDFATQCNMLQAEADVSKAQGFDLLLISHQRPSQLYQNKVIQNLALDEELAQTISTIQGMPAFLKEGDLIYAAPQTLRTWMIKINPSLPNDLLNKIFEAKTDTWHEFFALYETIMSYNRANGTQYALMTDKNMYWIIQFAENELNKKGSVNFREDEFVETLKLWKCLVDNDYILLQTDISTEREAIFELSKTTLNDMGEGKYFPLPTMKVEHAPYLVAASFYVMPPYAPHEQKAFDFLTYYMSPEGIFAANDYRYGLLQQEPDNMQIEKISEANRRLWMDAMENSIQQISIDTYRLQETLLRFVASRYSLEKCMDALVHISSILSYTYLR